MRIRTFCWLLVVAFLPQHGLAGADVGYQLNTKILEAADEQTAEVEAAIEFKDRAWAAPGVEETDFPLDQPRKFDAGRPQRIRLEIEGVGAGPSWLDDVAWPRTRELFGLGRPTGTRDDRQVFFFGGIALQR